jgi:hypothetical protein
MKTPPLSLCFTGVTGPLTHQQLNDTSYRTIFFLLNFIKFYNLWFNAKIMQKNILFRIKIQNILFSELENSQDRNSMVTVKVNFSVFYFYFFMRTITYFSTVWNSAKNVAKWASQSHNPVPDPSNFRNAGSVCNEIRNPAIHYLNNKARLSSLIFQISRVQRGQIGLRLT